MGKFWLFAALLFLAGVFLHLGALSAWVVVLRFGLIAALAVIALLVLATFWRTLRRRARW